MKAAARQRGVITIFVSMMMLLLTTILVVTAYAISTNNLNAVGNVQVREEAISAGQWYIEAAIQSDFTTPPASPADLVLVDAPMDINNDGVVDYYVDREAPECIQATQASTPAASSVTLPGFSAGNAWNVLWEIRVNATDVVTGADVRLAQGVRLLVTDTQKTLLCGP